MTMTHVNDPDLVIGAAVRERRRKLGLSQTGLAEQLGISHQLLQKQEAGESRVSAVQLYRLARELGVPVDYFYNRLNTKATGAVRQPRSEDVISERAPRSLSLLLVEDNSHDQLLFLKAVEACETETEVQCCSTAVEAEDYLRAVGTPSGVARPPDLIFLDLKLPKLSGLEFLKSISHNSNYWHQPIIVLSNSVNASEMYECYRHGASAFVCKPYDFYRFVRVIGTILIYWSETVVAPTTY